MLNDWGVDRTLTRKLMQALGSMGPAACLFALALDQGAGVISFLSLFTAADCASSVLHGSLLSHLLTSVGAFPGEGHGMAWSVALLSATLALGGCQSAGLGSNHQDIAPRW